MKTNLRWENSSHPVASIDIETFNKAVALADSDTEAFAILGFDYRVDSNGYRVMRQRRQESGVDASHYRSRGSLPDTVDGKRKCKKCGEVKDLIENFDLTGKPPNRRGTCRSCAYMARDAIWASNPEKKEAAIKKNAERHRIREYGLSQKQYDKMLEEQNNLCAICHNAVSIAGHQPHVDHDHQTGRVRGILCFLCNTALGKFKDSRAILLSAVAYLDSAQEVADV